MTGIYLYLYEWEDDYYAACGYKLWLLSFVQDLTSSPPVISAEAEIQRNIIKQRVVFYI